MRQGRPPRRVTAAPARELPHYEVLEEVARDFHAPSRPVAAYITFRLVLNEFSNAVDAHFARYGLSQSRFSVLMLLRHAKGHQLTPIDLASKAGVRPATMTGLLAGLERDALVRREHQSDDRRVVTVHLLPKGLSVVEDIIPSHAASIVKLMEGLSDDDLEAFARTLTILRSRLAGFREA